MGAFCFQVWRCQRCRVADVLAAAAVARVDIRMRRNALTVRLSLQDNRLDQRRIVVLDVADTLAYWPANHVHGRVGDEQRF